DTWMCGPEKDIMKRPFILMTTIMGGVCWIVFSYLIIVNIANIHNDPPYWRSFLYGTVDIGLIWQLLLIWKCKDAKEWGRNVRPSIIISIVGAVQTFFAVAYYYMAKTEIFLPPIMQAVGYMMTRFSIQDPAKLEAITRKLVSNNPEMPYNTDFIPA